MVCKYRKTKRTGEMVCLAYTGSSYNESFMKLITVFKRMVSQNTIGVLRFPLIKELHRKTLPDIAVSNDGMTNEQ
jgi:hypothetical protein